MKRWLVVVLCVVGAGVLLLVGIGFVLFRAVAPKAPSTLVGKWEVIGNKDGDYDHFTFEEGGRVIYEAERHHGASGLRVFGSGTWSLEGNKLRIVEKEWRTEFFKNGQHDRTREASRLSDYAVTLLWVGDDQLVMDYEGQADEGYRRIE